MKTLTQRFNSKVSVTPACWLWTGARSGLRYGGLKHEGKVLRTHRVSYELHKGPIPDGMSVMHRCDNPLCVNPDHLQIGTHLDNMQDMFSKGRRLPASGERNGRAKLSDQQAAEVAYSTVPSEKLGILLGISGARVRQIRRASAQTL